jgi:RNA polymerase sigma-70 factor, ECF subfamily
VQLDGDRLARFRQGDRRVLGEIYRQHVSGVAGFLRRGFSYPSRSRVLRFHGYAQPFELDNALQETFARAFRPAAREGYDGLRPYAAYLHAIARNVALDELRQRPPLREVASIALSINEQAPPEGDGDSLSAEEQLLRGELAQLYADFIAELDAHDASFFLTRFGEQRTRRRAGQACGLSLMQSRTLERKLRERFLRFLQAHGYLEGYAGESACGLLRAV